ncbi:MAG: calcium/sodium antiporter [Verrucomicrobia bacterium]|nr:calcium/sodium antiporter [Verrucomicrobiota bacterium]
MPVFILIALLAIGLVALFYGGDWLTDGASGLALALKVSPLVVGLTIVSMSTSAPELFASLISVANDKPGLAMGNIVGSNIANIGLILAIGALIAPFAVETRLIKAEMPVLAAVTLLFIVLCIGGIQRWEGVLLLTVTVGYLVYIVRAAKKSGNQQLDEEFSEVVENSPRSLGKCIWLILFATALLAVGADLLVRSAGELATRLGVSSFIIGLTVVAVGTSLPELAATIAAARKRQADIVAGNIVGSNLFNLMLIGGATAAAFNFPVESTWLRLEMPAMMALTLLMWWMFFTDRKVTRLEGIILLAIYFAIILWSAS